MNKIQSRYSKEYSANFPAVFGNVKRQCCKCYKTLGYEHWEKEDITSGLCLACAEEENKKIDEMEKGGKNEI